MSHRKGNSLSPEPCALIPESFPVQTKANLAVCNARGRRDWTWR